MKYIFSPVTFVLPLGTNECASDWERKGRMALPFVLAVEIMLTHQQRG